MQIAIAGVENIGHGQVELAAEAFNGGQHPRQGAAGHDAVLYVISGGDATHGGEGTLAAFPEQGAVGGLAGLAHRAGAGLAAEGAGQGHRGGHLPLLAIELDQQHGRCVAGILIAPK